MAFLDFRVPQQTLDNATISDPTINASPLTAIKQIYCDSVVQMLKPPYT